MHTPFYCMFRKDDPEDREEAAECEPDREAKGEDTQTLSFGRQNSSSRLSCRTIERISGASGAQASSVKKTMSTKLKTPTQSNQKGPK